MKSFKFSLLNQSIQQLLSHLIGWLSDRAWGPITHFAIKKFITHYQVNLQEAQKTKHNEYTTFNAFFTRQLKTHARQIDQNASTIISPVDGYISCMGELKKDQLIQAKNKYYHLNALLAKDNAFSQAFYNGSFVTLYLSPPDYHRVHMPLSGKLLSTTHVPGQLFSVNPHSVETTDHIFARNERLICSFENEQSPFLLIMVGALLVGKMNTVWQGDLSRQSRVITHQDYTKHNQFFDKGEEIGCFKMGSTVILIFPSNQICWQSLSLGQSIQLGKKIGQQIS